MATDKDWPAGIYNGRNHPWYDPKFKPTPNSPSKAEQKAEVKRVNEYYRAAKKADKKLLPKQNAVKAVLAKFKGGRMGGIMGSGMPGEQIK